MIKRIGLKGFFLLAIIALSNVSFTTQKVLIFHQAGQGNWTLLSVPPSALAGHGNHGDIYYSSCCPCGGEEWACR